MIKCIGVFLTAVLLFSIGCNNKELNGPCFTAAQYRQEAGKARTDGEKAALLGKADALQHECDAQNRQLQDQQNHNAKARQR
jgi:hypothetical protein